MYHTEGCHTPSGSFGAEPGCVVAAAPPHSRTAKPAKRLLTCTLSSLSAGDYAVVQFVVKPSMKGRSATRPV